MKASGAHDLLVPKLELDPAGRNTYVPVSMSPAREEVFTVLIAAVIGLFSGLVVVWLRVAVEWARLLQSKWLTGPRIVLAPALGGFFAALAVQKFSRLRAGGITETKASLYLNNGYVSLRTTLAEFLGSAMAIGAGHPLGPEDSSLHIGAGVGSLLGRSVHLSRERLARLAPVGAAAGLAGALNAPFAAVCFVVEAVIGSWTSAAQIGSVVLGSVASVAVVRHFLGSQPLFHLPTIDHGSPRELLGCVIIGGIAGIAGLLFGRFVRSVRLRSMALPEWSYSVQVALTGIAVGVVAYLGFPELMGAGYGIMGQAANGQFAWKLLLLLAAMKLLLAGLSFGARTPGGIIAATLFIGAMLGAAMSGWEHSLFGHVTASVSAYALLGMAGLFAAVLRAPVAAVLLTLELGGSDSIIFPAIIAVGTSWLVARGLQRHSLFELLRNLDGMHLPAIEEQNPLPVLQVRDAMQTSDLHIVDSHLTLRQAWREVVEFPGEFIFIRHADATWTAINRSRLDQLEATNDPQQRLKDVLLPALPMPCLYPDLPLDTALRHFHRWPVLPVVSRADIRILQGVVTMQGVMSRYQAVEELGPLPSTTLQSA